MKSSTTVLEFNSIYKTFKPAITKYVNLKIRDVMIAEELINDVFVKVHTSLRTYDETKAKFNTWIFNIAKNVLIDHFRKKSLETTSLEVSKQDESEDITETLPVPTQDRNPLETMISDETMHNVQTAMSHLNETQREMLTMYAVDNLTYEEISAMLNMPMGTVKGTIFNARTRLKEVLGNRRPVLA